MPDPDAHRLTSIEQVRAIIGAEVPSVRMKLFDSLDETMIEFIQRSPLLLLATTSADGKPDVSPKGDGPGFVAIEDDRTLLLALGRHEEFTLYSAVSLQNREPNSERTIFELARKVDGWGRIHLVERLVVDESGRDESLLVEPADFAVRPLRRPALAQIPHEDIAPARTVQREAQPFAVRAESHVLDLTRRQFRPGPRAAVARVEQVKP